MLVVVGGANVARAQEVETPDLVHAATSESEASTQTELVIEEQYRLRVRRSRVYGGLLATGLVMAMVGTGGAIRTFCLGCDEGRSVPLNMNTWVAVGAMGGGTFVVGMFGLLTSGIRRHRLSVRRRDLRMDPAVQVTGGSAHVSFTVHGVW